MSVEAIFLSNATTTLLGLKGTTFKRLAHITFAAAHWRALALGLSEWTIVRGSRNTIYIGSAHPINVTLQSFISHALTSSMWSVHTWYDYILFEKGSATGLRPFLEGMKLWFFLPLWS